MRRMLKAGPVLRRSGGPPYTTNALGISGAPTRFNLSRSRIPACRAVTCPVGFLGRFRRSTPSQLEGQRVVTVSASE